MRLVFDQTRGTFDLALAPGGDLDAGIGNGGFLEGAVWASLFTDALASPDDFAAGPTPDLGRDRRGWWADWGRPPEDSLGSLLWLYAREKQREAVRLNLQAAATRALEWMVIDGVARSLGVTVEFMPADKVAIAVELVRPNGVRDNWRADLLWSGLA
ncbi:MAG: phage GP46 family protein [Enhydrobacter sp.]|nr:phage GP46 family protein [Enhydrobacter sp.]